MVGAASGGLRMENIRDLMERSVKTHSQLMITQRSVHDAGVS